MWVLGESEFNAFLALVNKTIFKTKNLSF